MIIDEAILQKKIGWIPHKNQQIILDGSKGKRNISICAGVRFGKSALCGYVAFKHLLCDNQRIWVVSLSYDMAQKVFKYVCDFAGKYDKRLLRHASTRPPQRFEIPEWNSFLECRSIENTNSLLGEELNLCINDEAARFPSDIKQRYLIARLSSRKGKNFDISTPFGKNQFFYDYNKSDAKFNFKTIDNPTWALTEEQLQLPEEERLKIQTEEWERIKKILPEQIFKQEYEATFLDDAASVFRNIPGIIRDNILKDSEPNQFYTMGVDLGKHEDFTVITVINRNTHELCHWDRFNKIDYSLQKQRIKAVAERYNRARVYIDSTVVGEPIYEDLSREGVFIDDYKFTNKSKKELVEKLSIFIEQQKFFIPPIPEYQDELSSFGYRLTDSGNVIYSAPEGQHDDCVYSLALAVWGLDYGIVGKMTPIEMALKRGRKQPINYI